MHRILQVRSFNEQGNHLDERTWEELLQKQVELDLDCSGWISRHKPCRKHSYGFCTHFIILYVVPLKNVFEINSIAFFSSRELRLYLAEPLQNVIAAEKKFPTFSFEIGGLGSRSLCAGDQHEIESTMLEIYSRCVHLVYTQGNLWLQILCHDWRHVRQMVFKCRDVHLSKPAECTCVMWSYKTILFPFFCHLLARVTRLTYVIKRHV